MKFITLASSFLKGQWWEILLGIVLFLVGLGLLVTIHELGHFIAAKSFNVYCSDFSIGFGTKIIKIKRKKGETTFSVGLVPLGGYVAMYGEDEDVPEVEGGEKIGKDRSLSGISRWKKIIIFSAGIVMNFILAYLIFLIGYGCFPQEVTYRNIVSYDATTESTALKIYKEDGVTPISDDELKYFAPSKDDGAEFSSKDYSTMNSLSYKYKDAKNETIVTLYNVKYDTLTEDFALVPLTVEGEKTYSLVSDVSNFALNNLSYSDYLKIYPSKLQAVYPVTYNSNNEATVSTESVDLYVPILLEDGTFDAALNTVSSSQTLIKDAGGFNLSFTHINNKEIIGHYNTTLTPDFTNDVFNSFGLSMFQYSVWLGWDAFGAAGSLWVRSNSAIVDALGNLFVGQGWDSVGGPVAILNATSSTLLNNPFYVYLFNWGMISVNLALFNLLPFPGLDGWQILVEIIEAIGNGFKKAKFKKQKQAKLALAANANNIEISNGDDVASNKADAEVTIGTDNADDTYKEWKIPAKVKGIFSYVGLGLLFALAAVIFVFDIIRMF
jgi:membrane-associated protease RseP (regulator of RpoE activity)